MQAQRIKSIKKIGIQPTLDLEVNHRDHNFYAEGVVVSNSHAVAYAGLAAATVYLKFKHPQQFFLSLLKMTRFEPDPIAEISKIEKELSNFGIKLLPPHVMKSKMDFSIEGNDIRFGLLSIKGISDKSIEKLNNFKNEFANKFEIFEAAEEAGLNIGVLCSLIQAGALEGFKQSRSKVVFEAQLWNVLTVREKKFALMTGGEYSFDLVAVIKNLLSFKDEKGKPVIKDSRMETIKKKCDPYREIYNKNKASESFANWYYEKTLLGYTYNKTLRDIFAEKRLGLSCVSEIKSLSGQSNVIMVGQVDDKPYSGVSKAKKSKYLKLTISDETGSIPVLVFNDKIEQVKELNGGNYPKEKNIVIIKGRRMEDAIFADLISVQDNSVYTKLSDLKKDQ